ncbi:hypothetical protein K438DRAFT_1990961 [Mycena galopus ATCC 62051]|nr:hypothetical protein K438DRAFT_1990961 [Mycena galopus ATCC 62051]
MFHGKIAQFRVVLYMARKSLDLQRMILDLIDLNKEKLEELAKTDGEDDKFLGKDLQFHRTSRLVPDWHEMDADELSTQFKSTEYSEEEKDIEPTPVHDEANPRRSKRTRNTAAEVTKEGPK